MPGTNRIVAYANQAQEYRKNAVMGASPVQLVVMLYDGALRFMEGGKRAMAQGEIFKQNDQLQRAQNIVLELMSTLDMKKGGDVSKNLLALYTYVLEQLVEANIRDDAVYIDRASKVMSELREGWTALDKSIREQTKSTAPESEILAA